MDRFTNGDEALLRGALVALTEAVDIIEGALMLGPCPLSKDKINDTLTLTKASTALIKRVRSRF